MRVRRTPRSSTAPVLQGCRRAPEVKKHDSVWEFCSLLTKQYSSHARANGIPFDFEADENCLNFCIMAECNFAEDPGYAVALSGTSVVLLNSFTRALAQSLGEGPCPRQKPAYDFLRSFIARVFSKAQVYRRAREALFAPTQPLTEQAELIGLLGFLLKFSRESMEGVPEQFLPDEWWSEANLHPLRWDKELIKKSLQIAMDCEDNENLEPHQVEGSCFNCELYIKSACAPPPRGCSSDPALRRQPVAEVLQDPACASLLMAALHSNKSKSPQYAASYIRVFILQGLITHAVFLPDSTKLTQMMLPSLLLLSLLVWLLGVKVVVIGMVSLLVISAGAVLWPVLSRKNMAGPAAALQARLRRGIVAAASP